jgi:hypothetical protein
MFLKKYLKILLFEHLRKILVFRMSLLWLTQHPCDEDPKPLEVRAHFEVDPPRA